MTRQHIRWCTSCYPSLNRARTHTLVHCRSLTRTDGVNGDSDRGVKQRSEIWRQEETESQNKRGGSRRMEDRMKLTDIKTARTHRESFPFLIANIQRLVGGGSELGREWVSLKRFLKSAQKTSLNLLLPYQPLSLALSNFLN